MRVIAGTARGNPLKVPPTLTRPSTDRLREALFSILQSYLEGATVLDLFAGSGALGIEALSRGAKEGVFVEHNRAAARCIRENLEKAGLSERARVHEQDAFAYLRNHGDGFDLILADPPYLSNSNRDFGGELIRNDALAERLADDGGMVVEVEAHQEGMEAPGWDLVDRRPYGRSSILFYARK